MPISPRTTNSQANNQAGHQANFLDNKSGFTLVEILIVLTIIAGVMTIGLPSLFKRTDNIRKVARQLTGVTREIRNRARSKNATYRLVIDMSEEPHKYWVEYVQGSKPIPANIYDESQKKQDAEDGKPQLNFKRDEMLSKKDKELPAGYFFGSVETLNTKEPITQGQAYVHYFPEGFVEPAAIQVTDRKELTWTFVISPLTGQADIFQEAKSLKELTE